MAETERVQTDAAPPLGRRASSGFAWLLAQSALLKVVGFGGQLVVALLLKKEDFGIYALALVVATAVGLLHQSGLCGVLISRGDRLDRWVSPAFWFSLTTGAIASVAMIAIAPVAARIFHDGRLTGLIWAFSLTPVFNAISLVPMGIMQVAMRFRAVSMIGVVTGIGSTLLTVVLAATGFHAYSFVIPPVVFGAVGAGIYWRLARPQIKPKLQFRRWRLLMVDTGYAQGVALMFLILGQADYFTLGCLKPAATVGVYFFAFTLSMQPVAYLAGSLGGILLPVLSRLRSESTRQTQAFIRSARQLALLGVPICVAQAVMARPLLAMLFHNRWNEAIPVFQVLSIGAAFSLLSGPGSALLQARGRFRTYFTFTAICAAFFVLAVQIGARMGGAVSVATAVTIFYLVFGPLGTYVAIAPGGGRPKDVVGIYLAPIVAGVVAFGLPCLLVDRFIPAGKGSDWPLLLGAPLLGIPIYIALARIWLPRDWKELVARIAELSSRVASGKSVRTENVSLNHNEVLQPSPIGETIGVSAAWMGPIDRGICACPPSGDVAERPQPPLNTK